MFNTVAVLVPLIAITAMPAFAGVVYINQSDVSFTTSSTVAQAKYRLSHTNFDQSLDNGTGTANTANFISSNLGNSSTTANNINGVTFNFVLDYKATEGFTYSMTNSLTGLTSTLRWGQFSSGSGTTAATLGGFAPDRDFNSLYFETRATQTSVNPTFTVSGLSFSSTEATTQGAFIDTVVSPTYSEPGSSAGFSFQRLVSDINLADINFTLTGQLRATQNIGNGSDEQIKFVIYAQNGTANIPFSSSSTAFVPEPHGLLGLIAMACLPRRLVRRPIPVGA